MLCRCEEVNSLVLESVDYSNLVYVEEDVARYDIPMSGENVST